MRCAVRIFCIIFLISFCCHEQSFAYNPYALKDQQSASKKGSSHSFLIDSASPFFASAYLFLFWITAPEPVQKKFLAQLQPAALIANIVTQYFSWLCATTSHEASHALANALLTNRSSTTHLGDPNTTSNTTPWFTIGNTAVEGMHPCAGSTDFDFDVEWIIEEYCKKNHIQLTDKEFAYITQTSDFKNYFKENTTIATWKQGVISAAGGLGGAAGYQAMRFLFFVVMTIAMHKNDGFQSLCKKSFVFDEITFFHLFGVVWPRSSHDDAAQMWRTCFSAPENIISIAVSLSPLISAGIALVRDYYTTKARNVPLHSLLLMDLANYYLTGFLHFEL